MSLTQCTSVRGISRRRLTCCAQSAVRCRARSATSRPSPKKSPRATRPRDPSHPGSTAHGRRLHPRLPSPQRV
ncbi:hypothetical protein NDU88_006476, partial [Pleurodeles waltl]